MSWYSPDFGQLKSFKGYWKAFNQMNYYKLWLDGRDILNLETCIAYTEIEKIKFVEMEKQGMFIVCKLNSTYHQQYNVDLHHPP